MNENELKSVDRDDFFIKITVELGPKFHDGQSHSQSQLLERLKLESGNYTGFVGPMFAHFAEHIEASGENGADLSEQAPTTLTSVYYGCGSCYTDGRPGSLCYWNDGSVHCDAVCGG